MKIITLLIKEVPTDNHLLVENTYIKQPIKTAFSLVENGYAVAVDKYHGKEINPFLSEEYPNRDTLIENGIFTEQMLEERLNFVSELNGIGDKTIQKYKELLGLVEVETTTTGSLSE